MGKTDKPIFLQTFPQVKFELSNWATKNLNNLNCETVGNKLRQKIIPKFYKSYLVDANEDLSLNDFLKSFNLKSISESTIWRWMRIIGFTYCDRKKIFL